MASPAIETLLTSNATSAPADYKAPPTLAQIGEAITNAGPDNVRLCLITCADPRCNPEQV